MVWSEFGTESAIFSRLSKVFYDVVMPVKSIKMFDVTDAGVDLVEAEGVEHF